MNKEQKEVFSSSQLIVPSLTPEEDKNLALVLKGSPSKDDSARESFKRLIELNRENNNIKTARSLEKFREEIDRPRPVLGCGLHFGGAIFGSLSGASIGFLLDKIDGAKDIYTPSGVIIGYIAGLFAARAVVVPMLGNLHENVVDRKLRKKLAQFIEETGGLKSS